jgi:hypothetical protein
MEEGVNHGITMDEGGTGPQDGEDGQSLTTDFDSGTYMVTLYAMQRTIGEINLDPKRSTTYESCSKTSIASQCLRMIQKMTLFMHS